MLKGFDSFLTKMTQPLPAGIALRELQTLAAIGSPGGGVAVPESLRPAAAQLVTKAMPYLLNDGKLSRAELVRLTADLSQGYDPQKYPVSAALFDQSADMLQRLGIEDKDGALARGLARASVIGSRAVDEERALKAAAPTAPGAAPAAGGRVSPGRP
jgi:hypothetical protein